MTRNELIEALKDLGIEEPDKALVSGLLNKFNEEKKNAVIETTNKLMDDIKDWKKPEEYQELMDQLNAERDKAALTERKTKYKAKNLAVDDEDILTLIDGKLKDSKDFDKDLEEYVKAHPSFIVAPKEPKQKQEQKQPQTDPIIVGGAGGNQGGAQTVFSLKDAINEHYGSNK